MTLERKSLDKIKFINFLIKAKRNTYAGKKNQIKSLRKGSVDFKYREGDFKYYDSYVGSSCFAGQEIVYYINKIIWAMNYYGVVKGPNFSGDFLKEALLNNTVNMPYRGPKRFVSGNYVYKCKVDGNYKCFNGKEVILYKNKQIYELIFNGGLIK